MNFVGIIPARYASTRFPGKPLVDIGGKTMIQRVYEQSQKALNNVVVATDDERIQTTVKSFGGNVVMTSDHHKSGTDRCQEALTIWSKNIKQTFDVVINIQGDEPFIHPEQLTKLKQCFGNKDTQIATLIKPIKTTEEIFNPNLPKVIFTKDNLAVYFSRSPIPYIRNFTNDEWINKHLFYKHIGIYAYRSEILSKITALPQSSLEIAESLEQNRWIENGFKIRIEFTDHESVAIDTPEDLAKVIKMLHLS
jgi:3-deoxy-manno-octulosonate cytidylyltransferase (CMP-KDO synthetase)